MKSCLRFFENCDGNPVIPEINETIKNEAVRARIWNYKINGRLHLFVESASADISISPINFIIGDIKDPFVVVSSHKCKRLFTM
jgi:hypothetical protein